MTRNIKAISFDFMGVFTDGERVCSYEQILHELLKQRYKISVSRDDVDTFWKRYIAYSQIEKAKYASPHLIPYFTKHFKQNGIGKAQAEQIILEMLLDRRGWYRIRTGATDTMRLLARRGVKIILTTDSIFPSLQRRILLQNWGILQYFDLILTSQEWGRKAGQSVFKIIPNIFGVKAHEILHIGDDMENDIIPARKVGFRTCLFTDIGSLGGIRRQDKSDFTVTNFIEVCALIKRINKW